MPYGRYDDFRPLSQIDDQDARIDRLDGGDFFQRWARYDETDGVARMRLKGMGPGAAVLIATGEVAHLPPGEIVRRIAPRNVRVQIG